MNAGLIAGYFVTTLKKSKQQIAPTSLLLIQFFVCLRGPSKKNKKKETYQHYILHVKRRTSTGQNVKTLGGNTEKKGAVIVMNRGKTKKTINSRQNKSELEGNNGT